MKITNICWTKKNGYTEERDRCRYMQAGMEAQRGHTKQCRNMIEDEIRKTEDGQRRIRAKESRRSATPAMW